MINLIDISADPHEQLKNLIGVPKNSQTIKQPLSYSCTEKKV